MSDHEAIPESEMDKSEVILAKDRNKRKPGFSVGKKAAMKVKMTDKDGKGVLDYYDFDITERRITSAGRYEYKLSYSGEEYDGGEWISEGVLQPPVATE